MKPGRPAQAALDQAIYDFGCALLDALEMEGRVITITPHHEGCIRISGAPLTPARARAVQAYSQMPRLEREAREEAARIDAEVEALMSAGSGR